MVSLMGALEYDVHCCFVFALVCGYVATQESVESQLYADNLKCVSRDPGALLRASRFTTGWLVRNRS